ncbi:hypothetical protein Tco_1551118, partial [Tanacetum coccineum]
MWKSSSGQSDFGNDHFGAIMGYGDYVIGDSVISRVYYVEGLGHNLFSVGQFCDSDLEVAFRKHSCFVRDINGADLLKGSRSTNLYTISIDDMMKSSPICLFSKASKSKPCLKKIIFAQPVNLSSGPEPIIMTPGQLGLGLAPTDKELEMLFQPMFDEYVEQSRVNEPVPSATAVNTQVVPPGTPLSTTIGQDAPSTSASSSTSDMHHPAQHQGIADEHTLEDSPITHDALHPSFNHVNGQPGLTQSSSGNVNYAEPNQVTQPPDHLRRWIKDHPLDNIIGNPSRPVSTKKQLASDALWCCFHTEL